MPHTIGHGGSTKQLNSHHQGASFGNHVPLDLCQPVGRQLVDVGEALELWVVGVHGNELVIALTLVKHLHDADGLGLRGAAGRLGSRDRTPCQLHQGSPKSAS